MRSNKKERWWVLVQTVDLLTTEEKACKDTQKQSPYLQKFQKNGKDKYNLQKYETV